MFRRMQKRFLDWPLAKKFVVIFSVMTVLSGALTVGALHLGLSVFEEKFYEKSLQELDFFVQRVDGEIQDVGTLTRSIAVDSAIQQQLSELAAADPKTAAYYYLLTGIRPLLQEKLYQSRQVGGIQFADLYGHTLTIGEDAPDPSPEQDARMKALLDAEAGGFALLPPASADYPYLLCGREILQSKNVSLAPLGTVVAALDVGELLDGQIGSLSSQPSQLYLYSSGQLVYSSGGEDAAFTLPASRQGYQISSLGGKKYFVCWMTSPLTGMRLCSVYDYNEIYGQTSMARNALIAGECGILLLFALVLLRMARFVTKPIHTLSEAVQVVEGGDFAAARALLPADPAGDEVGALTREFDAMLEQIDTLIHENYEKQLMLQETRYKMLQAQINPHFLYNTLSTLNWLVRAGNKEDAGKMIVSLGDILRAALSPRDNSTAAADVQLARSYIDIQQLRYKNRAVFTLTAEGELDRWYLPHFTLQPLVENAIHYGVESSSDVCCVDVSARADAGVLTLTVHNTGAPVEPEQLAAIRAFTVKPQGHGIGLKNIYERLAMLYRSFVFDFDSTAETGTTVRIVLRQEERRDGSAAER